LSKKVEYCIPIRVSEKKVTRPARNRKNEIAREGDILIIKEKIKTDGSDRAEVTDAISFSLKSSYEPTNFIDKGAFVHPVQEFPVQ